MNSGWNAAGIVLDIDRPVRVEDGPDPIAMAGLRLVDGIVRNLDHHVVKARPVVGVADVHSGPFAHRVEAAQHLDLVRAVGVVVGVVLGVFFGAVCHAKLIGVGSAKAMLLRADSGGSARATTGKPLRTSDGALLSFSSRCGA